jgi:hypothetical protein
MAANLAVRRWWTIMPIVFITYSLAYLDRANYGFAAAAGINQDLGVSKGLSSLIGALFFLGYFFFQIPGAIYAERRSVKKLVFASLVLGRVRGAHRRGHEHPVADGDPLRARRRRGRGDAGDADLHQQLVHEERALPREHLPDPRQSGDRVVDVDRVRLSRPRVRLAPHVHRRRRAGDRLGRVLVVPRAGQAGRFAVAQRAGKARPRRGARGRAGGHQAGAQLRRSVPVAGRDRLCAQYFCWSIGVYGFVLWLPSIVKNGSELGMVATGWLSALPYLAATIAMLVASWASDKVGSRRGFVWPFLLVGAAAFAASYALGSSHFWISYALLVVAGAAMYAPYGPFFAIVPELLPKNVAGGAMALINSMGALGSFVGSYFVGYLNGATGSPSRRMRS